MNMARSSDSNPILALLRDKTFQAREIRRVIKVSLFYLFATTALLGLFYHFLLRDLVAGFAPMLFVSEDMALVNETIPPMSRVVGYWMLAMLGINLLLTLGLGIYVTRRLGAPLLAIKRALREIGAGNLEVQLRASDYRDFGELAMELDGAQRSIREQLAAAKSEIARAAAPVAALTGAQTSDIRQSNRSQDQSTASSASAQAKPNDPDSGERVAPFGQFAEDDDNDLEQMRQAVRNCMLALDYFRVDEPASRAGVGSH